jgi:hypothetical protein
MTARKGIKRVKKMDAEKANKKLMRGSEYHSEPNSCEEMEEDIEQFVPEDVEELRQRILKDYEETEKKRKLTEAFLRRNLLEELKWI